MVGEEGTAERAILRTAKQRCEPFAPCKLQQQDSHLGELCCPNSDRTKGYATAIQPQAAPDDSRVQLERKGVR
jgi:hypothetical protein